MNKIVIVVSNADLNYEGVVCKSEAIFNENVNNHGERAESLVCCWMPVIIPLRPKSEAILDYGKGIGLRQYRLLAG
jgi:hypothetical protein